MNAQTNLLPDTCRRLSAHLRYFRFWAGLSAVVGLILTAASLLLAKQQASLAERVVRINSAVAPIHAALAECQLLQREIARSRAGIQVNQAIEQRESCLAIMQATVGCCRSLGVRIRLSSIRIDDAGAVTIKPRSPAGQFVNATVQNNDEDVIVTPDKQVTLTGVATADEDVSALIVQLQTTAVFSEVSLENCQAINDSSTSLRSFQIRCRR